MTTTSRMRSHALFASIDLKICIRGLVADVINHVIFWKIGLRVSQLRDPEKWRFPLKTFVALYNSVGTTVPYVT